MNTGGIPSQSPLGDPTDHPRNDPQTQIAPEPEEPHEGEADEAGANSDRPATTS